MKPTIRQGLVDADILCYACGFATQETTYQTSDGALHSTKGEAKKHVAAEQLVDGEIKAFVEAEPVAHAIQTVKTLLLRVSDRLDTIDLRLFLTGTGNFREKIATIRKYKGNRTADKPLHYDAIRNYLIDVWEAEVVNGKEADDALGMHQEEDTCIVTIDKDLNMVEGLHFNWKHDTLYNVAPIEATRNFYLQLLKGDTVDNIPGIPGIGEAKAMKALTKCHTEEDMYWKALEMYTASHDRPFEALLENGRLLWIMRKEGELWEPKF